MKLDEEGLWKGSLLFKLKKHYTRCPRLTAVGSSSLVWRVEWWPLKRYTHILISRIDGQIDGETIKTVRDFIFLGSKITADGDCSHEIKRRLLLGRKAMTNLLKSRDITLPAKVRLVKAMVFPVVMYGCETWTIKKAEHQRIETFWTVVLEKTPESPLDCKEFKIVHPKGNQSWIFIGRTDAEASKERQCQRMLKLSHNYTHFTCY